jgi:hypothetical protein
MIPRNNRVKFGGVLAIFGGILIVASGFAIHGFTLTVLDWLVENAPNYLPPNITPFLVVVLEILSGLIALGGITVIFGGIVILSGHLTSGRLLIAFGGGTGFIGFLIALGYSFLTSGPSSIIVHVEYWVGVVIAVVARWMAKA